ncbi:MAG: hypothetical protein AB7N91_15505 [Candidatus Tectimicrobiota bacterium]
MDLPTGYVVLEDTADDRRYATWHSLVDTRLTALRAQVRSMVSDRAKALIPLADKGLACLSIPDCFPLVHDIVQSSSLALGRRVHQAHQALPKAEERRRKLCKGGMQEAASRTATHPLEAQQAEVTRWDVIQQAYRHQRATLSLTLHPLRIDDSAPQTSTQVEARWHAHVEAIETFARTAQVPERADAMTKVKKPLPDVAALVDCWWQGMRRDLEHAAVSPRWPQWAQEVLLPQRYWE